MRVSVHQQGGAFGVDKRVDVVGNKVRVTDNGAAQPEVDLDASVAKAVVDLARTVKRSTVSPATGPVYDAMTTALEIDDGESLTSFVVRSGDVVSPELWHLVNMVKATPDRAVKK